MTNGGYVIVDCADLVLDGVENTLTGISAKFKEVYKTYKPVVLSNLTLKKELTGLDADVKVECAYANLTIANGVYVLTSLIASMNINVNITLTTDKYQGIKF